MLDLRRTVAHDDVAVDDLLGVTSVALSRIEFASTASGAAFTSIVGGVTCQTSDRLPLAASVGGCEVGLTADSGRNPGRPAPAQHGRTRRKILLWRSRFGLDLADQRRVAAGSHRRLPRTATTADASCPGVLVSITGKVSLSVTPFA